jgi:diaminopimelate epimerase
MKYEIYSGAGNDFVIFDNRENAVPFDKQQEFTRKVCTEQFKELDGVIFLEKPQNKDALIRMNYYNRDGSYGAMCGNGARCISKFAVEKGIVNGKAFNLEAVDKIYKAEMLENNSVRISFPPPASYKLNLHLKVHLDELTQKDPQFSILKAHWMQVGSEHFVLFINDEENKTALGVSSLDEVKINEWGKKLRHHIGFDPPGANVNFAEIDNGRIKVRTYERGVERETLACGTGIISTALVSHLVHNVKPPVKILSQSGEQLTVNFTHPTAEGRIDNVSLEGSARKVSEGSIEV